MQCGLCNIIITPKNKFVTCEICNKKIHKKCKIKYHSDVDTCIKCFECGGSIIKTKCCNATISLDYLSALTQNYYKINNIQNFTEFTMLDIVDMDTFNMNIKNNKKFIVLIIMKNYLIYINVNIYIQKNI